MRYLFSTKTFFFFFFFFFFWEMPPFQKSSTLTCVLCLWDRVGWSLHHKTFEIWNKLPAFACLESAVTEYQTKQGNWKLSNSLRKLSMWGLRCASFAFSDTHVNAHLMRQSFSHQHAGRWPCGPRIGDRSSRGAQPSSDGKEELCFLSGLSGCGLSDSLSRPLFFTFVSGFTHILWKQTPHQKVTAKLEPLSMQGVVWGGSSWRDSMRWWETESQLHIWKQRYCVPFRPADLAQGSVSWTTCEWSQLNFDLRVVFEFLKQKVANGLASFFAKCVGGFASHLRALASDLWRGKQFATIRSAVCKWEERQNLEGE